MVNQKSLKGMFFPLETFLSEASRWHGEVGAGTWNGLAIRTAMWDPSEFWIKMAMSSTAPIRLGTPEGKQPPKANLHRQVSVV
jgi:hypothetical protein